LAAAARSTSLDLALGKAMSGGNEWQRLARLNLVFEDGKAIGGKLYPERGEPWRAGIEKLDISLAGGALTGTLSAKAEPKGSAKTCEYHFTLAGRLRSWAGV
jgi:hypothetical protein